MARIVFRPALIDFLVAHEGMVVSIDAIMRALPEGANQSSVRSAMRQLTEDGTFSIKTLAAGHSWRVDGTNNKPTRKSTGNGDFDNRGYSKATETRTMVGPLEILGKMEGGAELVRDNPSGRLYTLKAL